MVDVGQRYADLAGRYIELFGDVAGVHADDVAFIERHLTITSGTVLDVGCGPGHLTGHLASRGVNAIGLDLVPAFLDHARTAHAAQVVRGSLSALPFRDAAASGLLAWYSLIHLAPDAVDGVLAELRRVVVDGATVVVGFFDGETVSEFAHRVAPGHLWPVDDLARRLSNAGLEELDRMRRPADSATGTRAHGAIAAIAV